MSVNSSSTSQARANDAKAKVNDLANQAANHPVVQNAAAGAQKQLNLLDRELAKFGLLNDFEKKTKVPKTYAVLGVVIVSGLIIALNLFSLASPITNLIGWVLPAYLSIAALESPGHDDDKHWLTYWIIFGLLNFVESAALRLVLYYFPMYFTFKLVATLWLMLPATRGAEKVYYNALRPIFQSTQARVPSNSSSSSSSSLHGRTGSSSTTTTNAPSTGYSTATDTSSSSKNPFTSAGTTGAGAYSEGLHTTSAGATGSIDGVAVPPASGAALPKF